MRVSPSLASLASLASPTHPRYAMKEVCIDNLNQKEREEAVNEIRLLASFRHANIVRYCDAFLSDNMLCIVRPLSLSLPRPFLRRLTTHRTNHHPPTHPPNPNLSRTLHP